MADVKTVTLLNAIKNGASQAYKDRVPTATQDNIAQVGTAILNYTEMHNEFMTALVNKIGLSIIKSKIFENPLKPFKQGSMEYGSDIEEIFVDIIKAEAFDPEDAESTLFKRVLPDVKAFFHRINRQDVYPVTIEDNRLKRAFFNSGDFNGVVSAIVNSLTTSDNKDEFEIMKHLIQQASVEGKFLNVVVSPVTDEATTKAAISKIKEYSNNLTFLSPNYNHAGVHTHTPLEDQIILINTRFDAIVDVEVLAAAFNMDKANFLQNRVLVDDFGGLSNVLCAVVDRKWFMCFDTEFSTEEQRNAKGKYYNIFLHHHGVYSTSPFSNAVLFVTTAPTLSSIDVYPATASLRVGDVLGLNVETTGTGNPSSKCTYASNNAKVTVSSAGVVSVLKGATGTATITATSVVDNTKTDTCVITIV